MNNELRDNNDENLVKPEVLKKINQDLEKEILTLHNKISNLEKQNEILLQNLEKVKSSEETIANLQNEIVQLNNKISDLEEDNAILDERNKKLNIEELEKSSLQDKIKELEESIISLEKVNKIHRDTIDQLRAEKFTEVNKLENEIERLNAIILNLEEENDRVPLPSETPSNVQLSKIAELEDKINEQTAYISYLEEDNTALRKKVKGDQGGNEIDDLKQNIHRLQKKIANLEKENNELNEKNQLLKTALLLHIDTETKEISTTALSSNAEQIPEGSEINQSEAISMTIGTDEISDQTEPSAILDVEEPKEHDIEVPKGLVQELINKRHAAMEEDGNEEPVSIEVEPKYSTGKVRELINKRHAAMEEVEKDEQIIVEDQPKTPSTEARPTINEKAIEEVQEVPLPSFTPKSPVTPEEAKELSNLDSIGVIETPDGRRKCPICNNQNHRLIREVEDKSKVINAYPKMYGKKFKCGQCGAEWR